MTQRDQKTVLIIVLSMVGAGAAYMLLQSWFLGPLGKYTNEIATLTSEVTAKQDQIDDINRGIKLLKEAKARSLPSNLVSAAAAYDQYLVTQFTNCGLTELGVTPQLPSESKAGLPATANAPKKAGHSVLTYVVHAKGSLLSVVRVLENLQRTPVFHRVKALALGRQEISAKDAPKDVLTVNMTLEVLIAAGMKPEFKSAALDPDTSVKLPSPANSRQYKDIALKNIFLGYQPPAPVASLAKIDPIEDIIPEHVKLNLCEPSSGYATLKNMLFHASEMKLKSKKGTGYNTFQIRNATGTKTLVQATVLRIDQREVYFQVKDEVYKLPIGETVAKAMRLSLSDEELQSLQLTELVLPYDAKKDAPKDGAKKDLSKKGKQKKGPPA